MWAAGAFLLALTLAGAVLARFGAGERGTDVGLAATARLAFCFFWLAYAGGSLAALFGPAFSGVKRRGQALGLAFAAVLAVHLGLVAWTCWIGHAPPVGTFVVFGPGAAFTALLTLSSIRWIGVRLGEVGWSVLRGLGMNYLLFDFAVDFFRARPPGVLHLIEYLPFQILVCLAVAARVLSALKHAVGPMSPAPTP
jgi:hypothetical protein